MFRDNGFWIGLSDAAVEGVFRWLTNEFPLWSHWDAGFPLYSSMANCVWVNRSNSMLWRDANCSELHGFICEYIADTATSKYNAIVFLCCPLSIMHKVLDQSVYTVEA